ncbi:hypothetical protein K435DRAFT_759004 [Dendrothele bispora CBS 962.96]|uniref:C2H2-type domain-containing protein n=1 Tax=Dendrothele bispora (strain CBS 962.96) TaxID=1314807 RepID=A0A4V4HEM2_DENBC|nr:hypothetical protein K435DRAFT_759004 [Dendrothele bispora CBS 962.96]
MPTCFECGLYFNSDTALRIHCETSPDAHSRFCIICKREFRDAFTLQKTTGQTPILANRKCLFCERKFKYPSCVANHIEAGGCNKKINRYHVTAAVHAMDISPNISISKSIDFPSLSAAREIGLGVPKRSLTTYSATELAFNGKAYECYLCHREFSALHALNSHLKSPAHDDDEFICPNFRCRKTFKVISALIRHIESESCGLTKFQTVENYANALSTQFSRMLKL